ncbi:MAG: hypothetical protein KDK04_30675 [Candidatus Competibacteraceae bacterium]|nr:hypothetical protein [Candidatus Competibacteraceae bacterium]MCB1816054.1 hypothetical protein [Candidatus Competibacteraceae bacterium]
MKHSTGFKFSHIACYVNTAVLVASMLLTTSTASAEGSGVSVDKKIFPATVCQVWGGDKSFADYISYSQFGQVMNTHPTKKIHIVCPVMREHPDRRVDIRVYWIDGFIGEGANNLGTLSCRLRSNTVWGDNSYASVSYNSAQYSGILHNGVESGNWLWQNLYANGESIYTLFCGLPPAINGKYSGIGSFRTAED